MLIDVTREAKTMPTSSNAETAAKINAMEHVAELYKQADDQKQGFVLAYMDIIEKMLLDNGRPPKSA